MQAGVDTNMNMDKFKILYLNKFTSQLFFISNVVFAAAFTSRDWL